MSQIEIFLIFGTRRKVTKKSEIENIYQLVIFYLTENLVGLGKFCIFALHFSQ